MGTALVLSANAIERSDGTIKYHFCLEFDHSIYRGHDCERERFVTINSSGVPKAHHKERWAKIMPDDIVYIQGVLNSSDEGKVFITIKDLSLAERI